MKTWLALVVVLFSTAAFAQSSTPSADQPPDQATPAAKKPAKPKAAKQAKAAPAKGSPAKGSVATRLQTCQDIDDGTKERLSCYDGVIAPAPKPKAGKAKTVMDCKFNREEDERLACYNGFVDNMPKLPKS